MVTLSCIVKKNHNLNLRKKVQFSTRVEILIFLLEATQGDHIRLLYEFEICTKNFGCVINSNKPKCNVKTCYLLCCFSKKIIKKFRIFNFEIGCWMW